jgi:hypothetical protein
MSKSFPCQSIGVADIRCYNSAQHLLLCGEQEA